jgi:rod shape-determining protein MreC
LTVWQHRAESKRVTSLPERIIVAMGRPLQFVFTTVSRWPRDLALGLVQARQIVQENESLRQQLAQKQAQVTQSIQYYLENKALLESLGLPPQRSQAAVPARVIGLDIGPRRCRAIVQLPKSGLAAEGDIVTQNQGLVGRVLKVQGRTAEVMLLIDSLSAVAGRDSRSRDEDLGMGIVYPQGGFSSPAIRLKMEKLRPLADLREGDLVTTSGLDAVYPPSLPIGTIERVVRSPANAESVTAIIKPAVDFFRLEYVYVTGQN